MKGRKGGFHKSGCRPRQYIDTDKLCKVYLEERPVYDVVHKDKDGKINKRSKSIEVIANRKRVFTNNKAKRTDKSGKFDINASNRRFLKRTGVRDMIRYNESKEALKNLENLNKK